MVDVPDLPPQYAQVMIVQAGAAKQGAAKTDRTIGVCHLIENPPIPPGTAVNAMSPLGSVSDYFWKVERLGVGLNGKVNILDGPKHGELGVTPSGNYRYFPASDYYGPDRATMLVEIGGRKVKAIYFFNVMQRVPGGTEGYDPYEDKKLCPQGRRMWKISLYTDDPNGGLISFKTFEITHKLPHEP